VSELRQIARRWLRTLGRRPKDRVRLKLSAQTAAMAAGYLRGLGPLPEAGDGGQVRQRLLCLLERACAHGRAVEHPRTFAPYE
jgi:hypothetical protein